MFLQGNGIEFSRDEMTQNRLEGSSMEMLLVLAKDASCALINDRIFRRR